MLICCVLALFLLGASSVRASETETALSLTKTKLTLYKGGKKKYTIDKVSGEMSRLKELFSWVWNKDLEKKK